MSEFACWLAWLDAHAAAVAALATIFIAFFTIALAWVSWWQSGLIGKQVRLARDEFISSHRPRLILREAYTAPDQGHPITVFYALANTGGTETTIIKSKFAIFFSVQTGTKRQVKFEGELMPGEIPNVVPAGTKIEAGSFYESSCAAPYTGWSADWQPVTDDRGHQTRIPDAGLGFCHVYFYGKVSYKDASYIVRNMAFYRILDFYSYRFIPFGDPQLEYSDERV